MPLLHLIIVAIVQGITEFLPVSSSGHLILVPYVTGYEDQGQIIDVAVHLGTLGAVILYFWQDAKAALVGLPGALIGRRDTPGQKLAFLLMVATVPIVIAGFGLKVSGHSDALRSITVIGWATLVFGVVLWFADRFGQNSKTKANWSIQDAVIMGLWQVLSLIPGTSRSGITITGARQLGYARKDAAKLAMLMSIPTIIASGVLLGGEVLLTLNISAAKDGAIAAVLSFFAALVALHLMMRLLNSTSFTPYVIYRIALGVVLLTLAYS